MLRLSTVSVAGEISSLTWRLGGCFEVSAHRSLGVFYSLTSLNDLPLSLDSMSLKVFTQSFIAELDPGLSGFTVFRATVSLELDTSSSSMGTSNPGEGTIDVTSLALLSGLASMSGYCRESTCADSDKKGLIGDGATDSALNIAVLGVESDEYRLPVSASPVDLPDLARHLRRRVLALLLRGDEAAGRSAQ